MDIENPFTCDGVWLRANLHTHTTESDGYWPPAQTVAEYRRAGYDVLAITDHNARTDVTGLSDDQLLVLPGQEMHPTGNRGIRYHLVAVNLPETVPAQEMGVQQTIDAARAAGALVYVAHPPWCGLSWGDVAELDGLAGIEVWNATCLRHAKPSSESLWDELLAAGRLLPVIATDDCHHPQPADFFAGDFCQAWSMVRAEEKSAEAFTAALAAGRCYSSTGPSIEDFRLVADPEAPAGWRALARFSESREIWFVSNGWCGTCYRVPKDELDVTEMEHPVKGGAEYVRLVVQDMDGRRAWSNPLVVPPNPAAREGVADA